MKRAFLLTATRNAAKRIPLGLGFALAVTFVQLNATAQEVNLLTANGYAVLADTAITAANPSLITGGDVGLSPGGATSITGPITFTSPATIDTTDADALQARNDLINAYTTAAGLAVSQTLTDVNLGGLTLTPGVYFFKSSAQLTGTLMLDDQGNPDAVFVFQIGSTLTTASDASVVQENVATGKLATQPGMSVFWQVGSSATLGTTTEFVGNILAHDSITDDGGSTVNGRLLALNAAVTLNNTTINTPPAEQINANGGGNGGGNAPDTGSTLLLLGTGLAALFAFGRRFSVSLG